MCVCEILCACVGDRCHTHTHTHTHTRSPEEPGGLAVSPGRSRRKFHAPLHTENVSFILTTEKERERGGGGVKRVARWRGRKKKEEKPAE